MKEKSQTQIVTVVKFIQYLREKLYQSNTYTFKKKEEEILLNSFYEANTIPFQSRQPHSRKTKLQTIFYMNIDAKLLHKVLANLIQEYLSYES